MALCSECSRYQRCSRVRTLTEKSVDVSCFRPPANCPDFQDGQNDDGDPRDGWGAGTYPELISSHTSFSH